MGQVRCSTRLWKSTTMPGGTDSNRGDKWPDPRSRCVTTAELDRRKERVTRDYAAPHS